MADRREGAALTLSDRRQGHLFVVGFMGAGKTTVAALLAERLGRRPVDLDTEVERLLGRPIAEALTPESEPEFRRVESEALAAITVPPAVVATGGGAWLVAANRRRMRRAGVTLWLDVSLAEARRRTASGAGRPLWRDADPVEFRAFFERRRAAYALADLRVETSEKSPKNASEEAFALLQGFF